MDGPVVSFFAGRRIGIYASGKERAKEKFGFESQ